MYLLLNEVLCCLFVSKFDILGWLLYWLITIDQKEREKVMSNFTISGILIISNTRYRAVELYNSKAKAHVYTENGYS